MERATWVEVSSAALATNLARVREHAGVPVCAVVKANAYGHGLVEAARTLASAGAAMLAVARVDEARALRDAGVAAPLVLLMPAPDPRDAVALDCAITVGSTEAIAALPAGARAHLKVDTGMGRLGVRPAEAVEAARAIAARATLEAVWTHFADAAGPSGRAQLARFLGVREAVRAAGLSPAFHAANSAAAIALPEARLGYVRVGTLIFGQAPVGVRPPFPLEHTFAWFARVAEVREVPAGATVGYGREWRARRPTRLATLPVGWADGFGAEPTARTPSLREAARLGGRIAATALGRRPPRAVLFGERPAPVVGRIGMQAVTVAVDGLDDVRPGSVARVPARRLLVSAAIERVHA